MSLFTLIRERIVPINAVIALSVTLSLALDFLAPKAPYLAWVSYALLALVLVCMLAELFAPDEVSGWLKQSSQGASSVFKRLWMGQRPGWRSPAWQAVAVVTLTVLILGQVSKAKAAEGGILASQFSNVSNLQAAWFDLKQDNQAIKAAVKAVGDKVDGLKTFGVDLGSDYALRGGNVAALKGYLAKGESLPLANTAMSYSLAGGLSQKQADRLDLLAMYVKDNFNINQRGKVIDLVSAMPKDTADKLTDWGKAKGIPFDAAFYDCEFTLLHVATITADKEAIDWLLSHGASKEAKAVCGGQLSGGKRQFTVSEMASAL